VQVSDSSSRILAGLLEARTGQQLTMNRRWRIETALSALLRERGISSLDELITILVMGKEPALSDKVVEALLNNETYFFRDRAPFDLLARHALPELAKKRHSSRRIKIWSAGCATGQEVYSLAMLFAEDPSQWRGWTIDLLGTDVSTSVIDRARSGLYSQFEVQRGLGINQTIRWFEECEEGWRASRNCASRSLPGAQSARTAAASRRFRHRAVPQRPFVSQRREKARRVRPACLRTGARRVA
jgi:chemotaxis protein methyltransferase CheR